MINYHKQFYEAAKNGDLQSLINALELGKNLTELIQVAFNEAAQAGHLNILEYLFNDSKLKTYINLDENNGLTLDMACSSGNTKVVLFLLENGANHKLKKYSTYQGFFVNTSNNDTYYQKAHDWLVNGLEDEILSSADFCRQMFYWAKENNNKYIMDMIEKHQKIPNSYVTESLAKELEKACKNTDMGKVKEIINQPLFDGQDGLHIACRNNNLAVFKFLEKQFRYDYFDSIIDNAIDNSLEILSHLLEGKNVWSEYDYYTVEEIIRQCCNGELPNYFPKSLLNSMLNNGLATETFKNIAFEFIEDCYFYYQDFPNLKNYFSQLVDFIIERDIKFDEEEEFILIKLCALNNDLDNLIKFKNHGLSLKDFYNHYTDKSNWLSDVQYNAQVKELLDVGLDEYGLDKLYYSKNFCLSTKIEEYIQKNI